MERSFITIRRLGIYKKFITKRERDYRKQHGITQQDIHNGNKPREFDYNGTAKDFFKQKRNAINPLSFARDNLTLVKNVLRATGQTELANDPKVIDKLKAKGVLPRGLDSVPKTISKMRGADQAYGGLGGATSFQSNSIGYNKPLLNKLGTRDQIEEHEREHAKQGGILYNLGGNKATEKASTAYASQAGQGMVNLMAGNIKGGTSYFAHPLEYHANRAGFGEHIPEVQREKMVKAYYDSIKGPNIDNSFVKSYGRANRDQSFEAYKKSVFGV